MGGVFLHHNPSNKSVNDIFIPFPYTVNQGKENYYVWNL
jgi:hypothetical protein